MSKEPDYNTGKTYAWSGGERPVHPDSEVEVTYQHGFQVECSASDVYWSQPLLFRVTKQHIKPLELWVNVYPGDRVVVVRYTAESAKAALQYNGRTVHMREVTE